jgi:transcriptional regulator
MSFTAGRRRKPDALRGALDLLILRILSRGPNHGFGIALRIEEISDDALRVEEGSLYPALHRMEHAGLIAAGWKTTDNKRRARMYRITKPGLAHLESEEQTWRALTGAIAKVLKHA